MDIQKLAQGHIQVDKSIVLLNKLSLEGIGLYNYIKVLSDIPNFKLDKNVIQGLVKLGDKPFNRLWKELKDAGILIMNRVRNGKKWDYSFELKAELQRKFDDIKDSKNTKKSTPKKEEVTPAVELDDIDNTDNYEPTPELPSDTFFSKTGVKPTDWQSNIMNVKFDDKQALLRAIQVFIAKKGKNTTLLFHIYCSTLHKKGTLTQELIDALRINWKPATETIIEKNENTNKNSSKGTKFNNYPQRDYDYESLELDLIGFDFEDNNSNIEEVNDEPEVGSSEWFKKNGLF